MFPETSSTVRPALLKRGSPGPGAIEVIETSGNSGVIYYKPPARSTSPGASLPGQPVPERAHRNRCQLTPPRQFTKPQPNQRKPSQHQPATGSLISPLPLSGLLGPPPDRAYVVADLPRVAAILQRVAADIDELARARRVADLAAAVLGDRRAERRRQAAEPDLDFREFCRRSKLPQSERSWDLFAAERYRRGETGIPSYEAYNPFRHRQPGLHA